MQALNVYALTWASCSGNICLIVNFYQTRCFFLIPKIILKIEALPTYPFCLRSYSLFSWNPAIKINNNIWSDSRKQRELKTIQGKLFMFIL